MGSQRRCGAGRVTHVGAGELLRLFSVLIALVTTRHLAGNFVSKRDLMGRNAARWRWDGSEN